MQLLQLPGQHSRECAGAVSHNRCTRPWLHCLLRQLPRPFPSLDPAVAAATAATAAAAGAECLIPSSFRWSKRSCIPTFSTWKSAQSSSSHQVKTGQFENKSVGGAASCPAATVSFTCAGCRCAQSCPRTSPAPAPTWSTTMLTCSSSWSGTWTPVRTRLCVWCARVGAWAWRTAVLRTSGGSAAYSSRWSIGHVLTSVALPSS